MRMRDLVNERGLKGYDPATKRAAQDIRAHYPNAPSELAALLKYVTRISGHSKDEDKTHDKDIAELKTRVDRLEKMIGK